MKTASGNPAMPASRMRPLKLARFGWRYLRKFPGRLCIYITLSLLCSSVLPVATTMLFTRLTNSFQQRGDEAKARSAEAETGQTARPPAAPAFAGMKRDYTLWTSLLALGLLLGFIQKYSTAVYDAKMATVVRQDVFEALLRKDLDYFHENDPGKLNMTLSQLAVQAQRSVRQLLVDPAQQVVSLVIVGVTIFGQIAGLSARQGPAVWAIFGGIAAIALVGPWMATLMGGRLSGASRMLQERMLRLGSVATNIFAAPEEIKALGAEKFFGKKHRAELDALARAQISQSASLEQINALNQLPSNLVLALLIGLAVWIASSGSASGIEPGVLIAIALLTPQFMASSQLISSVAIGANLAWPGCEAIISILDGDSVTDAPEGIQSSCEPRRLAKAPEIVADSLVFSYRPESAPRIFDGASFAIPSGKITGLVARPGRGKSTFFRLLLKLYEPQSGSIRVGNELLGNMTAAEARRSVLLVSQHPSFFHDTVRTNFQIARNDATDEEIEALCRRTGLWDILVKSHGPNPLSEEFAAGAKLSGGQKRLFALTRCLLNDPAIMLLDEPTTGMGPLEKLPVSNNLRSACAGRTAILVDHDIQWLCSICDWFLVLDGGHVVQSGTREELQSAPGLFLDLLQASTHSGTPDKTTHTAQAGKLANGQGNGPQTGATTAKPGPDRAERKK